MSPNMKSDHFQFPDPGSEHQNLLVTQTVDRCSENELNPSESTAQRTQCQISDFGMDTELWPQDLNFGDGHGNQDFDGTNTIVIPESETTCNTEDSISTNFWSPADYGIKQGPNSDYFEFTGSGSDYHNLLPRVSVDGRSDYAVNIVRTGAQCAQFQTWGSDPEKGWVHATPLHTTHLNVEARHSDLGFDGTNAYGGYDGNYVLRSNNTNLKTMRSTRS